MGSNFRAVELETGASSSSMKLQQAAGHMMRSEAPSERCSCRSSCLQSLQTVANSEIVQLHHLHGTRLLQDDDPESVMSEYKNNGSSNRNNSCCNRQSEVIELDSSDHAGSDVSTMFLNKIVSKTTSFHIPESGTFPLSLAPVDDQLQELPPRGSYYASSDSSVKDLRDVMEEQWLHSDPMSLTMQIGPRSAAAASSVLPIVLKFEDVKYKVEMKAATAAHGGQSATGRLCSCVTKVRHSPPEKFILNGITASVAPGEMLALMGPSGSGKTTLLNALAGRLHKNLSGTISFNGLPFSSSLKRRMGFVTQDDVMFPMLTVRESLLFAALLRLPNSMTRIQKIQRADTVLKELGLERCKNTIIGGPFVRGVSGGERKRTSIGYEILVDPSLLYLDEPTSGLDSTTALRILKVLQKNAQVGRGILATIHQPSSRMFHMFDKLILLSEGYPIFAGYAKDAMDYFSSLSLTPQIAMNPADFLLDLATGTMSDITIPHDLENLISEMDVIPAATAAAKGEDHHAPSSSSSSTPAIMCTQIGLTIKDESRSTSPEDFQRDLVHKYMRRKYMTRLVPEERRRMREMGNVSKELEEAIKAKQDWSSSWWTQFLILFKRTFNERRVDYFSSLKVLQAIGVAVLLGLLWWHSKTETNADIQDQLGLIFYICIFWATFSMWTTLMTFPMERQYLAKERAADMYRLSAYYMSSTVCDCLAELVFPTIFLVILYYMTSLRASVDAFFLTLLATFLIGITGQGFGEMFGAATLSLKTAGIIASMFLLVFLLAGGYYVQKMPAFMKWVKYLSFVYYGFRLLQKIQYSPDQIFNCNSTTTGGCESIANAPALRGLHLNSGIQEAWVLVLMAVGSMDCCEILDGFRYLHISGADGPSSLVIDIGAVAMVFTIVVLARLMGMST